MSSRRPVTPLPTLEPPPFDLLAESLALAAAGARIALRLAARNQRPRELTYASGTGPGVAMRIPVGPVEGAISYFIERDADGWLLLADPSGATTPTSFATRTARRFPAGALGLRQIEQVILAETRSR